MPTTISEAIYNLPKKDLKKWIELIESQNDSADLKIELDKLKAKVNVSGTGRKSKKY